VPLFVGDAARQDPARGRLVDRIGARQVASVGRQQVWLEDRVHANQTLHGLIPLFGLFEAVHEPDDLGIGGLGDLCVGAELGQAAAERVAVLGQVPHVAPHDELRGDLGRQRDPAADGAHGALDHVAVVPEQARRIVGAEVAVQGLRHAAQ
jgi:hypothetical protein